MINQVDFGADLAGKQTIREPRLQSASIGAQHIRHDKGINGVRACSALAIAPLTALDNIGRDDVDLGVATVPKEIDQ